MSVLAETNGLSYCMFNVSDKQEFQQISSLIERHLSEPYSIYVYWYFLNSWPQYCYTVKDGGKIIGVIISKVEPHRGYRMRGYIGMLVIDPGYRKQGIASHLVRMCIDNMEKWEGVDEVMLETEVSNKGALHLYESFGFLRTKRLFRYYMNTQDAYRLILPMTAKSGVRGPFLPQLESTTSTSTAPVI